MGVLWPLTSKLYVKWTGKIKDKIIFPFCCLHTVGILIFKSSYLRMS